MVDSLTISITTSALSLLSIIFWNVIDLHHFLFENVEDCNFMIPLTPSFRTLILLTMILYYYSKGFIWFKFMSVLLDINDVYELEAYIGSWWIRSIACSGFWVCLSFGNICFGKSIILAPLTTPSTMIGPFLFIFSTYLPLAPSSHFWIQVLHLKTTT